MDYEFDDKKPKSANNELVLLRKAISELLREGIKVNAPTEGNAKQIQLLAKVADQLERLGVITKASKPESTDTSKIEAKLEKLAQAVEQDSGLTKTVMVQDLEKVGQAIFDLNVSLIKAKGNSDDPTDYVNVRLTDGKEFYNAVKRAIASVSESFAPFVANDTLTPVPVRLNADGTLPVSATFQPPANQNVTVTNSLPTGGNLIGAVVLASGVTVAPNTGIQSVFVTGGQAVALSGSVTVNPVIQQNVSISGALPGGANGLGSVTVTSGNITVTNFPTSQNVVVTNSLPQHNVTVSGNVTAVATSGTLNSHIDNWPTTQHTFVDNSLNIASVLSASGVQNVHVDNYPSVQGVFVQNPTTSVAVTGTVATSGTVGGTLTAIVPNVVTISGTVGGTVNAIVTDFAATQTVTATSGTLNAHVDNFPTIQQVAYPSLIASGIQHTLVDNFPSGFSINGVQGTVNTSTAVTSSLAASGVNNSHIDNWPTVQHVFTENPVTSVSVSNTVAISGTVGGTLTAIVPNTVTVGGNVTATSTSGNLNAHVDNWPLVQHVFVENQASNASAVTIASGTSNINIGNFPSVQATKPVGDSGQSLVDDTNNAIKVNVVAGGAGGGVADTQVRDLLGNWHDVGFRTVDAMMPTTVSGLTASGINHVLIDNYPTTQTVVVQSMPGISVAATASGVANWVQPDWPNGFSVNQVQGTVAVSGTIGGVVQSVNVASSGVNNVHVDNYPSVQSVFVQNPTTSVNVTGTVATSGTVGGTVQAVVQNFNPLQESFIKGGTVVIASGVAATVTSTSGTLNAHVDNWPTVSAVRLDQPVNVASSVAASGVNNAHIDNFPTMQGVNVEVSVPLAISSVLAASGVNNSHVDNWPSVQHVYLENPSIAVAGLTTSGTNHILVDNFPTNQTVNIRNINTDSDGTVNVDNTRVGNTTIDVNTGNATAGTQRVVLASNQPAITTSGNSSQSNYQINVNPLKTIAGSVSALGMTTVVSGIASQYIKVYAYFFSTAATSSVTVAAVDTNAIQAWSVPLQAITGTYFGSNLSIDVPSYLFKTASAGAGLALNLSAAQTVNYNLSYWYDTSAI